MTSRHLRIRILAAFFGFVLVIPRTVEAQPPVYLTQWGSYGSGSGQFDAPIGVAVDASGNVYVADGNNHRIQKFTGNGSYLTQWGTQGTADGQFDGPFGVAVDASGNVFVSEYNNRRIQSSRVAALTSPSGARRRTVRIGCSARRSG
jgi:DNA-binding beta-propeller fold protein YncE